MRARAGPFPFDIRPNGSIRECPSALRYAHGVNYGESLGKRYTEGYGEKRIRLRIYAKTYSTKEGPRVLPGPRF